MSIAEIHDFLEEHKGKFFSSREIGEKLGLTKQSLYKSLKIVIKREGVMAQVGLKTTYYTIKTSEVQQK